MALAVAIDVETTGFGFKTRDRIIEVAGLVFDTQTNVVLSRFETLINPLRNIPESSTKIHKLTAAHLSMAPTFIEFGPWLAHLLGGKRVIGHNILFDVNFLNAEFARIDLDFRITEFDCTRNLFNNGSLSEAADYFEIEYDENQKHGALYDAELCFKVFTKGLDNRALNIPSDVNAKHELAESTQIPALVTRKQLGAEGNIKKNQSNNLFHTSLILDNPVEACYLWRLADYLGDLKITSEEKQELDLLAADLSISPHDQVQLHTRYVRELEKAAMRDGLITDSEQILLEAFAKALSVQLEVDLTKANSEIPAPGSVICVTGTTSINGEHWGKEKISSFLFDNGFVFTDVLNKSANVALLLQESEGSQSSKVEKARNWGIPRKTIENFVNEVQALDL